MDNLNLIKKFLLALSLFVPISPSVVFALDLSDIRTEIRVRIKDTHATNRRYSDAQLLEIINQTQRDVATVSWIIKKSTSITLVSGTTYYTLPTDVFSIDRVTFQYRNIPESSLQELDSRFNNSSWANATGTIDRYFQDLSQPSKIGVYPWPNSSASTGTLRINYIAQAADLASDSDEPFNGDDRYTQYHDLLIYDPCNKIFLIEGDLPKADQYRAYYEARVQLLLDSVGSRPNYRPSFGARRE